MLPTDWPAPLSFAVETTLGVTALVLLVLVLRRPVAKRFGAGAAYALWAVPLIRLVLPPLPGAWSIMPARAASDTAAPLLAETVTQPSLSISLHTEVARGELSALPTLTPPAAPMPVDIVTTGSFNWPLAIAAIWLFGAVLALGLTLYRHHRFMQVVDAEVEPASDTLQEMSCELAAEIGLKRHVRVCESFISSGPMVTGLVRPTILLPVWFEADYSAREQRAAIAHELTHVKRRDLWALQFAYVATALQWFNPLAHWALRAFRSDQEAACDADVLRRTSMSPREYGSTLVKAARLSHAGDRRMMAAGLPLTHAIKDRLVLMQSPAPSLRKKLLGGGLMSVVGACAIMATASAHPPSADITISNGELVIDGKTYSDRKLILLDEPHSIFKYNMDFGGDMDFAFEFDMSDFEDLAKELEGLNFAADIDLSDLSDLAELAELAELSELEALADLPEVISEFVSDVEVTTLDDGSIHIEMPSREIVLALNIEEIEARAEEIEARAEEMAERIEARAEAYAERIEARAEEMAERFEARAEANAERIEARAEAFAHRMEMKFDRPAIAIEEIARACAEETFSGQKSIVIRKSVDGEDRELKAICTHGDATSITPQSMQSFFDANPDITEEERKRFFEELHDGQHSSKYEFELRGGPDSAKQK